MYVGIGSRPGPPQVSHDDPPARGQEVHLLICSNCQAQLSTPEYHRAICQGIIHLTPRDTAEPPSTRPGLQGQLFGILIWRGNLGHLVAVIVLCTNYPTKVPRESSTATLTIQVLVRVPAAGRRRKRCRCYQSPHGTFTNTWIPKPPKCWQTGTIKSSNIWIT